MKKSRVKQVKENTVVHPQSVDTINSGAFCTVRDRTNLSYLLKDGRIDDPSVGKDRGNPIGNLTNQTRDRDVNSSSENIAKGAVVTDLYSKYTDRDPPRRAKDALPTFDRDKYENLSQDTDYQLPHLKVLGRVDVEFKFTSTFCPHDAN